MLRTCFITKQKKMASNFNEKFEVPERIFNQRIYGAKSHIVRKSKKNLQSTYQTQETEFADEQNKHFQSILQKSGGKKIFPQKLEDNDDLQNLITVVGVTAENIDEVEGYFRSLVADEPIFENDEDVRENGLNWIYVKFSRDPSTIDGIKPIITFDSGESIGVYQGKFGNKINVKYFKSNLPIYRSYQNNENVMLLSYEEKSFMLKLREFIFGEGQIDVGSSFSIKYLIICLVLIIFIIVSFLI